MNATISGLPRKTTAETGPDEEANQSALRAKYRATQYASLRTWELISVADGQAMQAIQVAESTVGCDIPLVVMDAAACFELAVKWDAYTSNDFFF